ncbi:MAG: chloride channel protein [Chloroflexota bacterium]
MVWLAESWQRYSETIIGLGLAVIVGILAGLGTVLFKWLLSTLHSLFFENGGQVLSFLGQYYVILLPAAGGLLVGPLIYFLAREAKGIGVPDVLEAVALKGGRIRSRVAVVKLLATTLCIGSGGSGGSVGPIVQIGASIGSAIGQRLKLPDEQVITLLACGAAGGISAIFNAPIGGAIFALEVILGRVVTPRFAHILVSSVVADYLAHLLIGRERVFSIPEFGIVSPWEIGFYVVLGILAAFAALAFIYLLYRCQELFSTAKLPDYLKPALGGLAVGLLGLYSGDLFGVGFESVEKALWGQMALGTLLVLGVLKILATSVTIGSGGSGGIFAPCLFIGAMLGGAMGNIVHGLFPTFTGPAGAYGLVGMAAVFAAAARAPFSAMLILFEMTGDYDIVLPLITAVVVSTLVARALKQETIFTEELARRGIYLRGRSAGAVAATMPREAKADGLPPVSTATPIKDLLELLHKTGQDRFPVQDKAGSQIGVVTLTDTGQATQRDKTGKTDSDTSAK